MTITRVQAAIFIVVATLIGCRGGQGSPDSDPESGNRDEPIAWIHAVNTGRDSPAVIVRNDRNLAAEVNLGLYKGDAIRIDDADSGTSIDVVFVDGEVESYRSSSHLREIEGQRSGVFANALADFFGFRGRPQVRREFPYGREDGSELRLLPGIPRSGSQLVAGSRSLRISWRGGNAPFSISLRNISDNQALADAQSILVREYSLPAVSLSPGSYKLELADSKSRDDIAFNVVDQMQGPDTSAFRHLESLGLANALAAHFLASQSGGQWIFEAYLSAFENAKSGIKESIEIVRRIQRGEYLALNE